MAALGMIEVYGFATSIVVADIVAKTANVKVVAIDRNKPANADKCEVPLVMVVKFMGDPSAVVAAHDRGVDEAKQRGLYITSKIIAGLDPQVEWFAHLTATGRDKLRNIKPAQAQQAPAAEDQPAAPKKTSSKKTSK
ncbi:MAG: BMC domain-containing protein [Clostridia bacterium]|jgi:microcompartment protein CcmL/EutN|nr:BMC domain-containing protein [Clostridia bacterium]MBQ5362854.1 BMC domain-containing protein [Clostridia bacterium]MBQ5793856.1 BMC domain-containing protein [Clostridia bacterium]